MLIDHGQVGTQPQARAIRSRTLADALVDLRSDLFRQLGNGANVNAVNSSTSGGLGT